MSNTNTIPLVAGDPKELHLEAHKQMIDALGVLTRDTEIKSFLLNNDPNAFFQAQDAFRNALLASLVFRGV